MPELLLAVSKRNLHLSSKSSTVPFPDQKDVVVLGRIVNGSADDNTILDAPPQRWTSKPVRSLPLKIGTKPLKSASAAMAILFFSGGAGCGGDFPRDDLGNRHGLRWHDRGYRRLLLLDYRWRRFRDFWRHIRWCEVVLGDIPPRASALWAAAKDSTNQDENPGDAHRAPHDLRINTRLGLALARWKRASDRLKSPNRISSSVACAVLGGPVPPSACFEAQERLTVAPQAPGGGRAGWASWAAVKTHGVLAVIQVLQERES